MLWTVTTKADQRPRLLADRHYTRQSPGHPMWTRPGWNQILYFEQKNGRAAVFCWWRPKWEAGIPGTERKDKLRCIECSIFRNETRHRSSDLIREAVEMVKTWEHALDVAWPDGLITGVSSSDTTARRHKDHLPGHCFREAGWVEFEHPGRRRRADVWLRLPIQMGGTHGSLRFVPRAQGEGGQARGDCSHPAVGEGGSRVGKRPARQAD